MNTVAQAVAHNYGADFPGMEEDALFDRYLALLRHPDTWGDDITLWAMSAIFQAHVWLGALGVASADLHWYEVNACASLPQRPINLVMGCYADFHYVSLLPQ